MLSGQALLKDIESVRGDLLRNLSPSGGDWVFLLKVIGWKFFPLHGSWSTVASSQIGIARGGLKKVSLTTQAFDDLPPGAPPLLSGSSVGKKRGYFLRPETPPLSN